MPRRDVVTTMPDPVVARPGTGWTSPALTRSPRILLGVATAIAVAFVAGFVTPYLWMTPDRYHLFWPRRWWLFVHLTSGTVALLVAPAQYWLGVTRRRLSAHRILGRIYLAAIAISTVAAVGLSVTNEIGALYGLGLLGLAAAWVTTTGVAWRAILRREIVRHREWMVRSVVVTFGFVWFRVVLGACIVLGVGTEATRFTIAAWGSWTVPLLLTELVLRRGRRRSPEAAFILGHTADDRLPVHNPVTGP
jgi:hypothetical protein